MSVQWYMYRPWAAVPGLDGQDHGRSTVRPSADANTIRQPRPAQQPPMPLDHISLSFSQGSHHSGPTNIGHLSNSAAQYAWQCEQWETARACGDELCVTLSQE